MKEAKLEPSDPKIISGKWFAMYPFRFNCDTMASIVEHEGVSPLLMMAGRQRASLTVKMPPIEPRMPHNLENLSQHHATRSSAHRGP